MNRPVVWSIQARDDFLSIVETIAQDNPDAAGRVAERIMRATVALSTMATGRVGRVDGTISIARIIHGARDWQPGEWPE
jgi:toxin ParE1/3/4